MLILLIFSSQLQKGVTFHPQTFNAQLTGYSSALWWYGKLSSGITGLAIACHFPKVTKWTVFCHQCPKTAILLVFAVDCEKLWIFMIKVCKTWCWYYGFGCGASFPLSDKKDWTLPSVRNLVVVLAVWLWRVISQRWHKGLYFVISAQNADFAGIWHVDCVKIVFFYI